MSEVPLIYDLSKEAIDQLVLSWGEPGYRADQIYHALYHQLHPSPLDMTTLPLTLRDRLDREFRFDALTSVAEARSSDGETEKQLFSLPDGQQVEAVLMRYEQRRTACISTQAGCGMGCVFCATGQMGLKRNLTSGEIISQVLFFARALEDQGDRLTNLVVMGMGEPFQNYDATMVALERLNDPQGFKFGARRMTVSTVGLVPRIRQFTEEGRRFNLAVSLHAATDRLRDQLVPINKRFPLESLLSACKEYVERSGRRITFEWALIAGVNDGLEQARSLSQLIQGMLCHVNLIPLNPTKGYDGTPASTSTADSFCGILSDSGISCTVRLRRGIDIEAGCGQLAIESEKNPGQTGAA